MSLRQTCRVRISGRNQRYRRALQTIQQEEYLTSFGKYVFQNMVTHTTCSIEKCQKEMAVPQKWCIFDPILI